MEKQKKKIIIIICAVLAFCIAAVAVVIPCLYSYGLLEPCHPLNEPQYGQIRVACVGDSVTYGMGIKGWQRNNYPVQLGNMLGDGYCVNNYGYSGRTAMYSGDMPYSDEKLYRQSLDFQPNIVFIMLGSNDSKPHNWKDANAYKADYGKLIDSYVALDSHPVVVLLSPVPAFEKNGKVAYNIQESTIANEIRPAVSQLATEKGLEYFDMYGVFEGHPEYYSDGVHPNAEGAELFADKIYNLTMTLLH